MAPFLRTQLCAAELADVIRKEMASQKAEGRPELQVGMLATKIVDWLCVRDPQYIQKPVEPFKDALHPVFQDTLDAHARMTLAMAGK